MKQLKEEKATLIGMMKKLLILQNLNDQHIDELFNYCEFFEYDNGETIVMQDTLSPCLYGILDGNVDVSMKSTEKKEIKINEVHCGDVFGEAAIFVDMKRTANVIAAGTVRLLAISREKFFAFIYKLPDSGIRILSFVIFSLVHKLKRSSIDLVFEKESSVSSSDIELLMKYLPPTIEDVIKN